MAAVPLAIKKEKRSRGEESLFAVVQAANLSQEGSAQMG
jgi:hypothetical protein